jgi:hypothetical protein
METGNLPLTTERDVNHRESKRRKLKVGQHIELEESGACGEEEEDQRPDGS